MAILAGLPPERGRILMVALDGSSSASLARLASMAGGSLVGTAPWPRSLIVESPLSALRAHTRGHTILLLRAPAAGCDGAAAVPA